MFREDEDDHEAYSRGRRARGSDDSSAWHHQQELHELDSHNIQLEDECRQLLARCRELELAEGSQSATTQKNAGTAKVLGAVKSNTKKDLKDESRRARQEEFDEVLDEYHQSQCHLDELAHSYNSVREVAEQTENDVRTLEREVACVYMHLENVRQEEHQTQVDNAELRQEMTDMMSANTFDHFDHHPDMHDPMSGFVGDPNVQHMGTFGAPRLSASALGTGDGSEVEELRRYFEHELQEEQWVAMCLRQDADHGKLEVEQLQELLHNQGGAQPPQDGDDAAAAQAHQAYEAALVAEEVAERAKSEEALLRSKLEEMLKERSHIDDEHNRTLRVQQSKLEAATIAEEQEVAAFSAARDAAKNAEQDSSKLRASLVLAEAASVENTDAAAAEVVRLQADLAAANLQSSEEQQQVTSLVARLHDAESSFNKLEETAEEVVRLQADLAAANLQSSEEQQQVTSLGARLHDAESSFNKLEETAEEVVRLQADLAAANLQSSEEQQQVTSLVARLHDAENTFNKVEETASGENAVAAEEVVRLQADLAAANLQSSEEQQQVTSLVARLHDAENTFNKVEETASGENAVAAEEVVRLQADLAAAKSESSEEQQQVTSLVTRLREAENNYKQVEETASAGNNVALEELVRLQADLVSANSQRSEEEQQVAALAARLHDTENIREKVTEEKQEIDSLIALLRQADESHRAVECQRELFQAEHMEDERALSVAREAASEAENNSSELRKSLLEVGATASEFEASAEEVARLRVSLADAQQECSKVRLEIEGLTKELQETEIARDNATRAALVAESSERASSTMIGDMPGLRLMSSAPPDTKVELLMSALANAEMEGSEDRGRIDVLRLELKQAEEESAAEVKGPDELNDADTTYADTVDGDMEDVRKKKKPRKGATLMKHAAFQLVSPKERIQRLKAEMRHIEMQHNMLPESSAAARQSRKDSVGVLEQLKVAAANGVDHVLLATAPDSTAKKEHNHKDANHAANCAICAKAKAKKAAAAKEVSEKTEDEQHKGLVAKMDADLVAAKIRERRQRRAKTAEQRPSMARLPSEH
eukprot:TRINITY_DN7772_c0_g1_i1.p1 TRINITY_DN7772_c0_g1~~TRINITY_DN7772_c0_g1_i1.p1  ORF type:complete len:1063 (+),score=228.53 TRINITY_DN7772_c0_g1_i1:56-3244(+)